MIEENHNAIIGILTPILEENHKAFSLASKVEVCIIDVYMCTCIYVYTLYANPEVQYILLPKNVIKTERKPN